MDMNEYRDLRAGYLKRLNDPEEEDCWVFYREVVDFLNEIEDVCNPLNRGNKEWELRIFQGPLISSILGIPSHVQRVQQIVRMLSVNTLIAVFHNNAMRIESVPQDSS